VKYQSFCVISLNQTVSTMGFSFLFARGASGFRTVPAGSGESERSAGRPGGSNKHLPILDVLRGMAAIWVCLFHFTRDGRTVDDNSVVAQISAWGWLGVQMFFVVSGYVIPMSMMNRGYRIRDFGSFMIRRMKRLEPPYVASVGIILLLPLLASLVPGYRGKPAVYSMPQLAAHALYLNALLDYDWINPVYWTLAIEFQYYIVIGLVFPSLCSRKPFAASLSVFALSAAGLLFKDHGELLPHWLPVFSLGICAWQLQSGLVRPAESLVSMAGLACMCAFGVGIPEAIAGFLTAVAIMTFGCRPVPLVLRVFSHFGTISYSLYLLHEPVGNRVFNLVLRLDHSYVSPGLVLTSGLVGSVIASAIFWRLVEIPAQRWSRASTFGSGEARSEG
jgi:peptidoglycan/LPS O-acetylase OafA/YrhL